MTQPPLKFRHSSPSNETPSREESGVLSNADRRRSPWRRRLVEAERGLTEGFRTDSTLVVHFFLATIVAAAAFVFGISQVEWGLLIIGFVMVFSAELFHLAMRAVFRNLGHQFSEPVQTARRIATAGVFCSILGAVALVGLIFIPRLWQLFTGN